MTSLGHPVVGIIGGMGPEATIDFMRRIVARTPARDDEDHIHLIVESNPKIPSRIAHLIELTGEDPSPQLAHIARNLEVAGATVLAMPCNTAHNYVRAIEGAVSIPLLDMVRLTARRMADLWPGSRVGLLASTAVHNTSLYAGALAPYGMETVVPRGQQDLMSLIRAVKRGDSGVSRRGEFRRIAEDLAADCDALLIACTELSVVATDLRVNAPLLDSMDVLTDAVVALATHGEG